MDITAEEMLAVQASNSANQRSVAIRKIIKEKISEGSYLVGYSQKLDAQHDEPCWKVRFTRQVDSTTVEVLWSSADFDCKWSERKKVFELEQPENQSLLGKIFK